MRRTRWMVVALAGGIAAAPSCRSATEIVVDVSTDASCADVSRGGTLVAGGLGRGATSACDHGEIGTLAFVPSAALEDRVQIQITTGLGRPPDGCHEGDAACIVARRSLRYVPHDTLRLPVVMHLACAGVTCPADQTCGAGGVCGTANVDAPGFAPDGDGGGAQPDAARDGAASDAGEDASADAPIDVGTVEGGALPCDVGTDLGLSTPVSVMSLSADSVWILGSGNGATGNFNRFDRATRSTTTRNVAATPVFAASNGADGVFWGGDVGVFYYPAGGTNTQVPGLSTPTAMAAVPGGGAASTTTEIWHLAAPAQVTGVVQAGAQVMAVDPGAAPWGLFAATLPSHGDEQIDHVVAGAPTQTLVQPMPGTFTALAANRTTLFMARLNNGTTDLMWIDGSGAAAATPFTSTSAEVTSMAASDSSVFWVETLAGQTNLYRATLPVGSAVGAPIAGPSSFIRVVADASCAYYVAADANATYHFKALSP